jgi:hypothetical protein
VIAGKTFQIAARPTLRWIKDRPRLPAALD